jgi:hypothetical protein
VNAKGMFNRTIDPDTGMYLSAKYELLDGVKFYQDNGANNWNHAMLGATVSGNQEIIDYCISCGANNWDWGLNTAALHGHINAVQFFIARGAIDLEGALENCRMMLEMWKGKQPNTSRLKEIEKMLCMNVNMPKIHREKYLSKIKNVTFS